MGNKPSQAKKQEKPMLTHVPLSRAEKANMSEMVKLWLSLQPNFPKPVMQIVLEYTIDWLSHDLKFVKPSDSRLTKHATPVYEPIPIYHSWGPVPHTYPVRMVGNAPLPITDLYEKWLYPAAPEFLTFEWKKANQTFTGRVHVPTKVSYSCSPYMVRHYLMFDNWVIGKYDEKCNNFKPYITKTGCIAMQPFLHKHKIHQVLFSKDNHKIMFLSSHQQYPTEDLFHLWDTTHSDIWKLQLVYQTERISWGSLDYTWIDHMLSVILLRSNKSMFFLFLMNTRPGHIRVEYRQVWDTPWIEAYAHPMYLPALRGIFLKSGDESLFLLPAL